MADDDLRARLAVAVAELGINVPVTRYEAHGKGGLKLWLYGAGHKPVVWNPKPKPKPRARAAAKKETVKDE